MRSDLPSGTVTFLFTDVEGSTKLLHELGAEGYAGALAEHRRVIREACAAWGGVEVDTQGDAFFFAFPTAPGALAAAEAMTAELSPGPIQVRIGLHTGTPLLTDEGYVGDDVHFAARVAGSGHGGQVILSKTTAELVSLELADLGEHRLKDIPDAVPIFQLGDGSFPPLKTISNTNLPRPVSSFVGREREIAEVVALLSNGARLVTLSGPGGSGKTRVAIEAAAELVPDFKAGVFWVGLATLRDPALVTETIAQTLGAHDGLADHIDEREMLLLLDNLEQVIDCAPELGTLLETCPNLKLLCTSRELLRIRGEVEYPVPPLAGPEAVSLFCERSQLEADESIADLCRRLDSLPLAVELAAARTSVLTPAQILDRLSQRLDLLRGGRDAEIRQQTLRATIAWSYDLLGDDEQRLFRRFSVFAGCNLEAADEVAEADLDTLQSLLDKSLLRFTEGRYWMLETIREFAAEQLEASGEGEAIRERHAAFMVRLAVDAEDGLLNSDQESFERLEPEIQNFRSALDWIVRTGKVDWELELIGRAWRFWDARGGWREGIDWIESALARSEGERSLGRAKVLIAAAAFTLRLGDLEGAWKRAEESLSIFQARGDSKGMAMALIHGGLSACELGRFDEATEHFEEAIEKARGANELGLITVAQANLCEIAIRLGDYDRAIELLSTTVTEARERGASDVLANNLNNLALCNFRTGSPEECLTAAREAMRAAHAVGSYGDIVSFVLLAAVAQQRGDSDASLTLSGAADAACESLGFTLTGADAELRRETCQLLRQAMTEDAVRSGFDRGRELSRAGAVAFALERASLQPSAGEREVAGDE
jgi:predicted ATPase